jgi:hypothetical protein
MFIRFLALIIAFSGIITALDNECKISYNVGKRKLSFRLDSEETCDSIAHVLNITVSDLQCHNPTLDCNNLQSCKKICLDCHYKIQNCHHRCCSAKVTVKSGDSCISIAAANGINIAQLESLNPGLQCVSSYIYPGQTFCVR